MSYTEANYENAVIELLRDELGYDSIYGPDIKRNYSDPLYEDALRSSLLDINPNVPESAIDGAIEKIKSFDVGGLIQKNERFTKYLQDGVEVRVFERGEERTVIVKLIDYDHVKNNNFCVANQWTVVENAEKRADLVVFVNGMPLVVVELKSCSREETDASAAYRQLRNYMKDIPSLFHYNAFSIMSDHTDTRAGTITSDEARFMEWKTTTGDYEETRYAQFDVLFRGMLEKRRLLDIVKNFTLFSKDPGDDRKIIAGYHQYYAVKKAVATTQSATQSDGKAGIFWHTQGSGKSLSMVFYTKLLQEALSNPTVVVLTDRNDLDEQLYQQFAKCSDFLRQVPEQATNRIELKKLLAGRVAGGIIFTTMQKFEEYDEPLSERRNIVLMADEAHRSQYALDEKVHQDGTVSVGYARLVRQSLPNASFIGFTGTPIDSRDHNTRAIFGNYIDVYDMTQAVNDGATRPVYYEARVINLGLNVDVLKQIDDEYDVLAQNAEAYAIDKSKKQLAKMDSILGAPQTIDALCNDIVKHYEDRQDLLTGKAMIVAYSREIAVKIYEKFLELRPSWAEKAKVVMTSGNNDPEEWKDKYFSLSKKELAKKFKDDNDPMKIAVVVDMWLTGFDVPSLATMYVYKPMSGHNLMQAIARVNRVFRDKVGGLVVDYVGIAKALKQAMNEYTKQDHENYGDPDIAKTALPKFIEKLTVCEDLFHGFDFGDFINGTDLDRAHAIADGINFILEDDTKKEHFIREAKLLQQAQTLCRSLLDKDQRFKAAFFEAVRTAITRIVPGKKLSLREINDRINELLKQSIKTEGVIALFADAKQDFSLFDPKFLDEIAKMKQKNLAVELLKKLLAEQIAIYKRTNIVQSELFSAKLLELMKAYRNGQLTNAEVIDALVGMAHDIDANHQEGEALGLTTEEKAFYDALAKPENIKDFYDNETLVQITKELTDALRSSRTIDWQVKESARAGMRKMVKRLLKKYKYPPEGVEYATETVIKQCEQWTDNEDVVGE